MYDLVTSKKFLKQYSKLSQKDKILVDDIVDRLLNGEVLEAKYKDHKLKGEFKNYRECHIKPDLLLVYNKNENLLILTAFRVGSHSELFE